MSYDLSRKTFNPLSDYLGVVMQQGRVQMDVDWNEMVAQFKRRGQAADLDTFNGSVVPRQTPNAFLIGGAAPALEIGPGRIYVDGILAENHTDVLRWDARLAEISGTAKLSGIDLGAAPSGPDGTTAYDAQPYYPYPPALLAGENYLVYLDVWQRDVTWLQDAELVDAAVGVDTTARMQTVWQVKVLEDVGNLDPGVDDLDIPGWLKAVHPSSARLSTDTGDLVDNDNPCLLPPQAGYKGLENQLYRVQVHEGGPLGTATFKWSRDNAVVATRVSAIPGGNEIVVESLGRDDVLGFHDGDWVEVTDDYRELMGQPGELRRIQLGGGINSATRRITLEGAALPTGSAQGEFPVAGDGLTTPARNTRVIRWDQAGVVHREDESEYTDLDQPGVSGAIEISGAGTRLFLENGVLVDFDLEDVVDEAGFDSEFRSGDYWIFAARVNDSSIEILDRAPPAGIHHHYSKLAIVGANGNDDCRTLWPPEGGEGGCACTVCVEAETHNNGSATIQQAVDQVIARGGGSVCLGIGQFFIDQPIRLHGRSVVLRGSGLQTILVRRSPGTLIDIGSAEETAIDITVERLMAVTSIARGVGSAVAVHNVFDLRLRDCLFANFAIQEGTSQALLFSGVAALVAIERCYLLAERGVAGPRVQKDFLATLDVSIRDCVMNCAQRGIGFGGISIHLGRMDIRANHISGARDAGIELSGGVAGISQVSIADNLLSNCENGIRTGVSRVRILHNDLEMEDREHEGGDAIAFVAGLEPGPYEDIQVVGNRVRNYNGHAITVQTGIGKMLVKQNQVANISGAAFVTEAGGSVAYLSLENNQFTGVDGILTALPGQFSAVFLEGAERADISNNVLDGVVRNDRAAESRAAIQVVSSSEVRVTGNRLLSVTPPAYTGLGSGIFIASAIGTFTVEDNEIRRRPLDEQRSGEKLSDALWIPLIVDGGGRSDLNKLVAANRPATAESEAARSDVSAIAPGLNMAYAPIVASPARLYVVTDLTLVDLGPATSAVSNVSVQGNRLDGFSSTTSAVILRMAEYCGFSDNEVSSNFAGPLAYMRADHVGANNNRLMTRDDLTIMVIDARGYVVMGNMTTGGISVIDDGAAGGLPEPWKSLNIII